MVAAIPPPSRLGSSKGIGLVRNSAARAVLPKAIDEAGAAMSQLFSDAIHLRARELFREACRVDPELAEGHIWLGRVSAGIVAYGWSDEPAENIKEGLNRG